MALCSLETKLCERVDMMLWLSGLMGLLAVGAFTLLWFLPFRKTVEDDVADEPSDDGAVSMADALMGPKTEAAGHALQSIGSDDEATSDVSDEVVSAFEDEAHELSGATVLAEDVELVRYDTLEFSLSDGHDSGDAGDAVFKLTADDAEDHAEDDAADWFSTEDGAPDFEEFDPQEDDLVVVWDDSHGPVPHVAVVRNEEDPSLSRVILGDTILAKFRTKCDVSYDAVSLVPLSRARSLGWA